jgi:ubiquinone/menaquinone biosynthesis C-methylase UbiE
MARHAPPTGSTMTLIFTRNIDLGDGRFAAPELGEAEQNRPIFASAKRGLRALYRGDFKGRSLVDLACLDGAHALGFARLGFDVLGVEVRDANFAVCRYVQEQAKLANLRYVQDNAWNLASHGQFDVVFCSGLLYHLDRPREFIRLLGNACRETLILNTHFAPDHETSDFDLSPVTEHEGLRGRWFVEPLAGGTVERDRALWSSWDNARSFWLMKPDLLQCLHEAGFEVILEAFDFLSPDIRDSLTHGYYLRQHRNMFVGVRDIADLPVR